MNTDAWERSYTGVRDLTKSDLGTSAEIDRSRATVRSILISGQEDLFLSWLLAAFVPWARSEGQSSSIAGPKALPPAAAIVVREGLKADNKVLRVVQGAVIHVGEIALLKGKVTQAQAEGAPARDVLGMAIRRWGQHWRLHVMLALLIELGNVPDTKHGLSTLVLKCFALTDALEIGHRCLPGSLHFSRDLKS